MPNPNLNIDTYRFEFGSGGGGTPEGITYVVDSSQKLNDWLTGVAGNDYTHVFIAPGRWSFDYNNISQQKLKKLDDVTVGTKTIDGAPGSVICDDNNGYTQFDYSFKGILGYTTRPTKNCYIKNVTFEFNKAIIYSPYEGEYSMLYNCINIISCNISSVQTNSTGGAPLACAYACVNISNCSFSTGYASTVISGQSHIRAVDNCINITNCIFNIINEAPNQAAQSDNSFYLISTCYNISDCTIYGNLTSKLCRDSIPSVLTGCYNVNNVIVYDTGNYGSGFDTCSHITNCIAKAFNGCNSMSHCSGYNINQYNYFELTGATCNNCYADHGSSNAVADTAAGGYNKVAV